MPDATPQQIIDSAQGHVEMYEASIQKRKAEIESGTHQIDEATTRGWLAMDEAELAQWRRNLDQAKRAAVVVEPLVP